MSTIQIRADKLYEICHNVPKVELHCHLFGTIRKDTFLYFNERAGKPFTDEEILAFYIRGEKPVGVLKAFRTLDAKLIKYPKDLYRLTYEYLEDAHTHNILYTEISWNPTGTALKSGISFKDAQKAIVDAIDDAEKKIGIQGRLICAVDRADTGEKAVEMVDWMLENPDPHTIGIGIDYRETDRGPELFHDAYVKAKRHGYKLTAHAGEYESPWQNVDYVVNTLHVDRVDHGYSMLHNPKLVEQLVSEKKVITVVPTNSYYLRNFTPEEWTQKHPIRKMIKLGLRIHPNTDDPTLHDSDSTKDWMMMVSCFGATISDLETFSLNGVDGCWAPEEKKEELRAAITQFFEKYL
uniref:Adenyl deaminase n=1 Tax=Dekkera bruxellensis TaxID=5007 RepID=A4ZQ11_DEKBR|nr:adenyl deaminase [Brettanomyces bruxellensis]